MTCRFTSGTRTAVLADGPGEIEREGDQGRLGGRANPMSAVELEVHAHKTVELARLLLAVGVSIDELVFALINL
jgi:hypothetical protein